MLYPHKDSQCQTNVPRFPDTCQFQSRLDLYHSTNVASTKSGTNAFTQSFKVCKPGKRTSVVAKPDPLTCQGS